MKNHAIELPLMKNQTRRIKTSPKIAPLIALAIFLLTIIPVYYPFLKIYSPKTSNSDSNSDFDSNSDPSPSHVSFQSSLEPSTLCRSDSPENTDCATATSSTGKSDVSLEGENVQEIREITIDTVAEKDVEKPLTYDSQEARHEEPIKNNDVDKPRKNISARRSRRNRGRGQRRKEGKSGGKADAAAAALMDAEAEVTMAVEPKVVIEREGPGACDIFSGEWVPNPEGPYYTNMTCSAIQEHQNCMKFGRPDTGFLKWRWKPEGCELPVFDPDQFLEIMVGKKLAFVGDSVARNHMQSLICLLSRV